MTFQWTDAVLEETKRLWSEGLSPAQIGKVIGTSRNSVSGKIFRTPGFERRTQSATKANQTRGIKNHILKTGKSASKTVPAPTPTRPRPTMPPMDCCQWIEGDPKGDFDYCGKPGKSGGHWCPEHHARVYVSGSALDQKNGARP